jgi:hypothetical protein
MRRSLPWGWSGFVDKKATPPKFFRPARHAPPNFQKKGKFGVPKKIKNSTCKVGRNRYLVMRLIVGQIVTRGGSAQTFLIPQHPQSAT